MSISDNSNSSENSVDLIDLDTNMERQILYFLLYFHF